jgi:hypothetical protein
MSKVSAAASIALCLAVQLSFSYGFLLGLYLLGAYKTRGSLAGLFSSVIIFNISFFF